MRTGGIADKTDRRIRDTVIDWYWSRPDATRDSDRLAAAHQEFLRRVSLQLEQI